MDLHELSDDDLADLGRDFFVEVERRIAASTNPHKHTLTHLVATAHAVMNRVRSLVVESGVIRPDSGGLPKPE